MANPFKTKYDMICGECGKSVPAGRYAFYNNKEKCCSACAESLGIVCECGKYKKPDKRHCYGCFVGNRGQIVSLSG